MCAYSFFSTRCFKQLSTQKFWVWYMWKTCEGMEWGFSQTLLRRYLLRTCWKGIDLMWHRFELNCFNTKCETQAVSPTHTNRHIRPIFTTGTFSPSPSSVEFSLLTMMILCVNWNKLNKQQFTLWSVCVQHVFCSWFST